jgi:hypothetical protein
MKFSMTGEEKCDLLIQVMVNRGNRMDRFNRTSMLSLRLSLEFVF